MGVLWDPMLEVAHSSIVGGVTLSVELDMETESKHQEHVCTMQDIIDLGNFVSNYIFKGESPVLQGKDTTHLGCTLSPVHG